MSEKINYNPELVEEMQLSSSLEDLKTIQDFLRWMYSYFNASDIFYGHGQDNAWDEAVQLTLSVLHLPQDVPTALYSSNLTYYEKQKLFHAAIQRVGTRTPIAYLTHNAWFCGLEFYVDERVIIPRSPIGELIQDGFTGLLKDEPKRILDMCTGSGCIAVACAARFPQAEIDAIDLSPDALQVAEINIERHNALHRVFPIQSDLFSALPPDQYNLIVSNPPYVDEEDLQQMPAEFYHEPTMALEAGQDGLILVKRILAQAADYLTDNGVLVCEVGNSMVHLIEQFPTVAFNWIQFKQGGDGVFSLTKAQLLANAALFEAYKSSAFSIISNRTASSDRE
ncbi:50S ribosomal protein L3 N(5)-glutamine methyltransferase [Testudinibacter aquarius]|uniref:Ribosomal protein uL3 glutamine methyltransferase n=1 Tax=Testudinibacter aquarius TaxID=1524974 RepID=A0A4R3Y673_9PAST|nr:50S ribosomal protein L3 N(5)-glutamine methyltransferase [Testudinibacter aquarius]KAE9525995.1 ribosomal protein L3 N(5)-glutamine methyltransferase [Testudinibacter aquarius]TCV87300.1 [LSU ribosomal protein L3P]-glutamine N5-methyltransferase [Testudinibacter aquarius]TNG89811.1 50S ribosomal protein L3 N(5)-glutamine methyltransferase [Testudinibacter aquarius]